MSKQEAERKSKTIAKKQKSELVIQDKWWDIDEPLFMSSHSIKDINICKEMWEVMWEIERGFYKTNY